MSISLTRSRIRRALVAVAVAMALVAPVGVSGATAAFAVPSCNPSDEPLPPACTPKPRPTPRAPTSLSYTFSPPAGYRVTVVPHIFVTLPAYADGATTPYTVYYTCSNGYHRYVNLRYFTDGLGGRLMLSEELPADQLAGTCTATSYDLLALGLTSVSGRVDLSEGARPVAVYSFTFK